MLDKAIVPHVVSPRAVPLFAPQTPVQDAIAFMAQKDIGCIAVVDDGRLVGIFTERDVLRRVIGAGVDPDFTPLITVMTRDPDSLDAEDRAGDALTLMTSKRYRHLPILKDGEILAILSIRDLQVAAVEALSEALDGFAELSLEV